MAKLYNQRMMARIEGDFVVYLIGMRIHKFWKFGSWLPVFLGMPKMIKELYANPESGFLGHESAGLLLIQYWRSFEHLEAYARNKEQTHYPAMVAFMKNSRKVAGDVGIWHETYRVSAGNYETVYVGMPAFGLGKAAELVPVGGGYRQTARGRMEGKEPAVQDAEQHAVGERAPVTA